MNLHALGVRGDGVGAKWQADAGAGARRRLVDGNDGGLQGRGTAGTLFPGRITQIINKKHHMIPIIGM